MQRPEKPSLGRRRSGIFGQNCIDEITKRARNAVREANSDKDACSALVRELQSGSFDEWHGICGRDRKGLGNFTVSSLGDLSTINGA